MVRPSNDLGKKFMEIIQGVLAIVSLLLLLLLCLTSLRKYQNSSIGEIGSFIGGIMSPIAILWIIYSQFVQSESIALNNKILTHENERLAPYIALSFEHEKFAYYESYEEMEDENEDKIKARKESNDNINLYNKIKHNRKNEPIENVLKKMRETEKKPLSYYGIEDGVAHIKTLIYNEGSPIYNATIIYKPDHHRKTETKYIKKIGKEPIEFEITTPTFYFLSSETNTATIEIKGTDIDTKPINKKILIYLRNEIKNKLKKTKIPDHLIGEIVYARRTLELLTYKVEDIKE